MPNATSTSSTPRQRRRRGGERPKLLWMRKTLSCSLASPRCAYGQAAKTSPDTPLLWEAFPLYLLFRDSNTKEFITTTHPQTSTKQELCRGREKGLEAWTVRSTIFIAAHDALPAVYDGCSNGTEGTSRHGYLHATDWVDVQGRSQPPKQSWPRAFAGHRPECSAHWTTSQR